MCVCVYVCVCVNPRCLDVAIEVSLALYLLEFPDVRYWNIDLGECLAFTLLWFHLYAHTADARFTQQYKLADVAVHEGPRSNQTLNQCRRKKKKKKKSE